MLFARYQPLTLRCLQDTLPTSNRTARHRPARDTVLLLRHKASILLSSGSIRRKVRTEHLLLLLLLSKANTPSSRIPLPDSIPHHRNRDMDSNLGMDSSRDMDTLRNNSNRQQATDTACPRHRANTPHRASIPHSNRALARTVVVLRRLLVPVAQVATDRQHPRPRVTCPTRCRIMTRARTSTPSAKP